MSMTTRTPASPAVRRRHVGADVVAAGHVSVRVWAPDHASVTVVVDGVETALAAEGDGYFAAIVVGRPGARYGFLLPSADAPLPDPASRWQPDGPHGLSAVVDPGAFAWRDAAWPGLAPRDHVIYEMHIGTFTLDGTWQAARQRLADLRDLGVTAVQVMPVAEFAGRCGWGYDGVQWFAPMHTYGTPDDLRAFVDAAHHVGLGVMLDVVYNHLGPAGNVLPRYAAAYLSSRHENEWGDALNFDGDASAHVRALVLDNVAYWIDEFHLDGFRIDAAQQMHDTSDDHILAAIARAARDAAGPRGVLLLAEHEPQDARLMRPVEAGGYGLDAIYNEDFHHTMRVALTGMRDAYLTDYAGTSREWLAAARRGFLYQGQYYPWQGAPRGAPALDRPASQFVCFLENHDQVANCADGRRLVELTSPAWWRAMTALLLLGPWSPLLFQGQEWASRIPFTYFSDHDPELQRAVVEGRLTFVQQFMRSADVSAGPRPTMSWDDCVASRLTEDRTPEQRRAWTLHRDLLTLRHDDPVLRLRPAAIDGATLGDHTLLLRFAGPSPDAARLLLVNLGPDLRLAGVAEPLLAPPRDTEWTPIWCSEARPYGGSGVADSSPPRRLMATGHAATLFAPTTPS